MGAASDVPISRSHLMIRMRTDFFAESLGMGTSMVVLMPQAAAGIGMEGSDGASGAAGADGAGVDGTGRDGAGADGRGRGVPVLYLLHGLSDDCTIWERRTSIERYATEKGIAVVMPEVRRSFYADEAVGEKYWTFIAEELPELIARTFRISTAREDTFVAGQSLGGFAAVKLALNHPERFAAAARLSGVLGAARLDLGWTGTEDDLLGLLAQADPAALPSLFLDCGTEDELLDHNRRFITAPEARGVELASRLRPGAHTWDFWDESIQDVLDWLPLQDR